MTPIQEAHVQERIALASVMVAAGLVVTSLSLAQLATQEFAQATTHSRWRRRRNRCNRTPGAESKPVGT